MHRFCMNQLKRHAVVLGNSGSGKTVACKVIVEDALASGLDVIAVDAQGDLASMALGGWSATYGIDVVIWTPVSDAGNQINLNPFTPTSMIPDKALDRALAFKSCASTLRSILQETNDTEPWFEAIMEMAYSRGITVESPTAFLHFAECLTKRDWEIYGELITPQAECRVLRKLRGMSVGLNKILYEDGQPLRIDNMVKRGERPTLNILYLNTLNDSQQKITVVNVVASQLYQWMLKNPSKEPQVMLFLDEAAPYVPAGAKKTHAKESIVYLLKQGRKYGVCCLIATQSPGDLDYKAVSQASTWMIGKLIVKQDINKVKTNLRNADNPSEVIAALPSLSPGEFFIVQEGNVDQVQMRMPMSEHTTLSEDELEDLGIDVNTASLRHTPKQAPTYEEIPAITEDTVSCTFLLDPNCSWLPSNWGIN